MPADPTPAERREEAVAIADALLALPDAWQSGAIGWSVTTKERLLAAAVRDLADENERLRTDYESFALLVRVLKEELRDVRAERDRYMQATLDAIHEPSLAAERDAARAENAALREALGRIAQEPAPGSTLSCRNIARAALTEEPQS